MTINQLLIHINCLAFFQNLRWAPDIVAVARNRFIVSEFSLIY